MKKHSKKEIRRKRKIRMIAVLYWTCWIGCWCGTFTAINSCLDPSLSNERWFAIFTLSMLIMGTIAMYLWNIILDALSIPEDIKYKIIVERRKKRSTMIDKEMKYSQLEKKRDIRR